MASSYTGSHLNPACVGLCRHHAVPYQRLLASMQRGSGYTLLIPDRVTLHACTCKHGVVGHDSGPKRCRAAHGWVGGCMEPDVHMGR